MRALALPRKDWLLVGSGGLLLVLAYPPFHLLIPSFICLVPVVWLLAAGESDPRPLRRHLVQGFWFGVVGNALVLYWMVVALWHFTSLSALGYAASVLVLGMWGALLFGAAGWIRRRTGMSLLVVLPFVWTAVEWMIGHQGDIRFPWLGLGTSLTGFPALVQIADVVGARGVTFLLVLANAALALAWKARGEGKKALRLGGSVVAGAALAWGYGLLRAGQIELRTVGKLAAIQPAIEAKWERDPDSVVASLLALSDSAAGPGVKLVVWPEAAVPQVLEWRPEWVRSISEHARRKQVGLVVGALDVVPSPRYRRGYEYFNAAFVFDSSGAALWPPYHKNYLVPIVERVPFVDPQWFERLRWFGGASSGEPGEVYRLSTDRFGILICYESAFENLSRRYRMLGADFLVNITNDAWFGKTSAPYQHAAHLVMRAIENRVGIVRAANTGISEFVDPLGRQHHRTRLGDRTLITGELVTSDTVPLYTRLGDWVGRASLAGTALLIFFALRPLRLPARKL
ncbi:Apolipoprotein N-acyltransferase [bacterium HR33]|nr:Apolipoprotein N-acyltransferase [bacterium HR33]